MVRPCNPYAPQLLEPGQACDRTGENSVRSFVAGTPCTATSVNFTPAMCLCSPRFLKHVGCDITACQLLRLFVEKKLIELAETTRIWITRHVGIAKPESSQFTHCILLSTRTKQCTADRGGSVTERHQHTERTHHASPFKDWRSRKHFIRFGFFSLTATHKSEEG